MGMGPLKFEFRRPALSASGEVGSLGELIGILQDEGSELIKIFGDDMETIIERIGGDTPATTDKPEPAKRGRKPKDATAPAPLPVPSDPLAIPPGLQRDPVTNTAPAMAPPPPPVMPAAPPIAPAAPPVSGPVGQKVIAELQRRGTDDAAKKQIVDWLAMPTVALVVPGSTFDESIACLRMITDDKLAGVATALGQ